MDRENIARLYHLYFWNNFDCFLNLFLLWSLIFFQFSYVVKTLNPFDEGTKLYFSYVYGWKHHLPEVRPCETTSDGLRKPIIIHKVQLVLEISQFKTYKCSSNSLQQRLHRSKLCIATLIQLNYVWKNYQ